MPPVSNRAPAAALEPDGDELRLVLSGDWRLDDPRRPRWEAPSGPAAPKRVVALDRGLARWDSSLALYLQAAGLWCLDRGGELDLRGLPTELRELAFEAAASAHAPPAPLRARRPSFVAQVGLAAERLASGARGVARFVGESALGLLRAARLPRTLRLRDWLLHVQQAGPEALGIVGLVSFLVGTIIAFQTALQLRKFGAEILVVYVVSASTAREMGPIIVGILLSGRTAAAYAAELGSMGVGEELDALEICGVSAVDFLVVPRLLALVLVTPLLTVYADALSILGGTAVAWNMLKISPIAFYVAMKQGLLWSDVRMGLIKSAAFGLIVGICGCHRGLTARRDAAGAGRAATAAVVTSILWVVVADSIFGRYFAMRMP